MACRSSLPASASATAFSMRRQKAGNSSTQKKICLMASSPSSTASRRAIASLRARRSEEHTSELQSRFDLVCRLLLEKKKEKKNINLLRQKKNTKQKSQRT